MYELKTILPQFDINLPTCMYTLKNVSLSGNSNITNGQNCVFYTRPAANASSISSSMSTTSKCALDLDVLGAQIQNIIKANGETDAVVLRQEKVLQQLKNLKLQLAEVRSHLGLTPLDETVKSTSTSLLPNGGLKEEPLHDVVINGHPNFIPYALLALKNAWKDLFTIDVKTFTHSTMTEIGPEAKSFEKKLNEIPINTKIPKINVTLIWKNCEHTEMISSPTMYVPIYGEVNIIRYLARVGPKEYRYEESPLCNEIDAVLDICYQLLRCQTQKTWSPLIRILSQRLQKQQYFGGNTMSIADVGVHTALKRMPAIAEKELTQTLREWLKRAQVITKI